MDRDPRVPIRPRSCKISPLTTRRITIFRRIGWVYHTRIASGANFDRTIDCHLAVLDAIARRRPDAAVSASDGLTDFVDHMFDAMEQELDPELLDFGESVVNA